MTRRNTCALFLSLIVLLHPLFSLSDEEFWYPRLPANLSLPGFFRIANEPQLSKQFLDSLTSQVTSEYPQVAGLVRRIQWTAASLLRANDSQGQRSAWLILAGTAPKDTGDYSASAFTKQAGIVVGCQLRVAPIVPSNFQLSACRLFTVDRGSADFNHTDVGLLGTGLRSAEFPSGEGGVLVYCDPLWHVSSSQFAASGRCTLRVLRQGAWQESTSTGHTNVDFCFAAGRTQPCGGGFSVDLRTDDTERVQLLTGLPLTQPHGRARIVSTVLSTLSASPDRPLVMHDIRGEREHFGSSVAWASCVGQASGLTAVISSPSVVQGTPSVHGYRLQEDEGVGAAAFKVNPAAILEESSTASEFGGFGLVVESVSLPSPSRHVSHFAVIIGAPYERVPSVGANTGRVYMYCHSDGNRTAYSGVHTLTGSRAGEQFGYTVSRIADVDGDGVEDVAIGAPALGEVPGIFGRVYIYRLLPTCGFEAKPFQILDAPSFPSLVVASSTPSRGFGIAISRGVDIDRDGGPEMVVTSLDPISPFYLLSMPRRLVARCKVSLPPKLFLQSTTVGTKFTVTFLVRLYDPKTRSFVTLPKNFLSASSARTHQINPDVIWQERLSQVKWLSAQEESNVTAVVEAFFASHMGAGAAQAQQLETRLELDDDAAAASISASAVGANSMQVKIGLRTRISGEQMKLNLVPLKIAYRYHLSDPSCSSYAADGGNCGKREQPLVDWSDCEYTFPAPTPLCAPTPRCEADLLIVGKWVDVAAAAAQNASADSSSNVSLVKIPYGAAGAFNRKLQLTIRNNGPTKASGVRVELRALGWPQNDTASGIRSKFVSINLRSPKNGALLAAYGASSGPAPPASRPGRPAYQRWSISVSGNEAAALITAKPDTWLYPDEDILLEVGLFLSGMQRVQDHLSSQAVTARGNLPSPGIRANVSSVVADKQPTNNVATVLYQIVYRPNIVIGAGEAVPTLIDDRKKARKLKAGVANKVFAHQLGPRLEHVFLIENTGKPELNNATLQLDIPVSTNDGDLFVYLSDRVRRQPNAHSNLEWVSTLPRIVSADGRVAGTCTIDPNFVDPLNVTIMDIPQDGHAEASGRHRRSVDAVETPPLTPPIDEEPPTVTRAYFTRSCLRQVLIRCSSLSASSSASSVVGSEKKDADSLEKAERIGNCAAITAYDMKVACARVICHLKKMAPSATVRVHVSGWLMASTFFKHHLPDVKFITRLSLLNWGDLPPAVSAYTNISGSPTPLQPASGDAAAVLLDFPSRTPTYEMVQSVVFRHASPRRLARMPLWPILTGIVVGSIILVTVISLLYYCGFFSRRKRTRAARRRAELTASYRRSVMAAGSGANAGGAGGFAGPVASKPDFLLPPEKNSAKARNGGRQFEREKGLYAAVPMVEGSADLVYAVSPEPPSPCAPEKEEFEPEAPVHNEAEVLVSSTEQLLQKSPPAGKHTNTAHSTSDLDSVEQLDDGESSTEALLTASQPAEKAEEVVEPAVSGGEPTELPPADSANTSGATQDETLPDWLVGEIEESNKRTEPTKPASSD